MRMKVRYVLYNLCMLFGCICFSCTDPTNELLPSATTGLTIQISTGDGQTFTRAESSEAENAYNNKIQYLDIFIFDSNTGELVSKDADNKCYWHFGGKDEYGIPNDIVDPVLLIPGNWKTRFAGHAECDVYVIANLYAFAGNEDSQEMSQALEDISTLNDLKKIVEENSQIDWPVSVDAKIPFAMSGYVLKWKPLESANIYTIPVELTRLAAKIEVALNLAFEDKTVVIDNKTYTYPTNEDVSQLQYSFKNYAINTLVFPEDNTNTFSPTIESQSSETDINFLDKEEGRSVPKVIVYTYPISWSDDVLKEPYVIINAQLKSTDDVGVHNNYYKIPLRLPTQEQKLERNHWYKINATISALGNATPDNPVELTDVQYKVAEWKDMEIEVGDDNPMYLELSEYEVVMRNVDSYDLTFASSSNIQSAKIEDVYFINKNGDHIPVTNEEIKATSESGLNGTITIHSPVPENKTIRYMTLTVKNEQGLTKTVTVMQYPLEYITGIAGLYSYLNEYTGSWPEYNGELFSHLNYSGGTPHYEFNDEIQSEIIHGFTNLNIEGLDGNIGTKAVMKSKFYVKNSSGGRIFRIDYDYFDSYNYVQTSFSANKTVYVRKYKLEDNKSDNDILVPGNEKKKYILTTNISDNGKYILENDEYIRVQDGTGTYEITYEVSQNHGKYIDVYGIETEYKENYIYYSVDNNIEPYLSDNNTASNNRMYHVVITSTSDGYQLARPPMTSEDENATVVQNYVNNTFVSPSFMLASQLGNSSVLSWSDAEKQCQNYVEVGMNGEEYNDWRLPTLEEIRIIKKYQEETPDVMDVVLETRETNENNENANPYYWTAIKDVYIYTGNATVGTPEDNKCRVRCVRDFHIGEPTE